MARNRTATILFIGILICVPLLALYQFGIFVEAARWLARQLPLYLVLPEGGVRQSLPLQYLFYSSLAFSSAWLGMELPRVWQKYLYLLALTFLTCLLTPLLAFNGLLFEPFSGTLAAWFAGLMGIIFSDQPTASSPLPEPTPDVVPEPVVSEVKPTAEEKAPASDVQSPEAKPAQSPPEKKARKNK